MRLDFAMTTKIFIQFFFKDPNIYKGSFTNEVQRLRERRAVYMRQPHAKGTFLRRVKNSILKIYE